MIYTFEQLELDTDSFQLRRDGEVVPLEPQTFDVLTYLVRQRGRVVPKEELLAEVWGTQFVTESALTTRIKQARQAVGDDGRAQRVIRTSHGRGYQFVAPVDERTDVGRRDAAVAAGTTELVERDQELAVLHDALTAVRRGEGGRIVAVCGEAGMGKTSLVSAFTAQLDDGEVLTGGCDDLLAPRALGPLRDIATRIGGPLADALATDAATDHAATELLDLLARSPTTLVIEDLHWADDATLDVVRMVARRIPTLPTLLVLTYRDQIGPDHPLRRVLAILSGPRAHRLTLQPLSIDAVTLLASEAGVDADDVHRITHGNPFFVTEVVASSDGQVPPTVRDAVLGRVASLSSGARSLVETVSVVPSRVERSVLDSVVSDDVAALAEAERSGVLGADATHVWFRHELARMAVESSLTTSERVHTNAAVLAVLEQHDGTELSRLVHHARQAGATEKMLRYADRAANEAIRLRSYRQALEYLALLLDHRRTFPDQVDEARALVRHAYVLYVLNRLEEAALSGRRAVALGADLELGDLVDAHLILSRAAYWAEGPAAATACIETAIALLGDCDDDERQAAAYADLARARSNLATLGIVAEPDPLVIEAAERSLRAAERLGRADLQSHALQYLGTGRLAMGDERGLDDIDEAVVLAEVDPRDELPVRACVNASGGAYRAGRLDEALRYARLGLERAQGGEFHSGVYRLELTIAAVQASKGEWAEAEEALARLIDRPGEPGLMEPLARSMLARLLGRQGRHAEAGATLAPALTLASTSGEIHLVGPVAAAAVELAWLRGEEIPAVATSAVTLAEALAHRSSAAEVVAYVRRAGGTMPDPIDPPGPWAPTIAGDHEAAATAWERLGDRYESALERALAGDASALEALGARASLDAVTTR